MRTPQTTSMRFHLAFAALGVAFFAIFSWVFMQEYFAEWRTTQSAFVQLERTLKDPHALNLAPPTGSIRQVWLPDIDRVDRCTTCHLGVDDQDFEGADQPFTTHSGTWLRTHPPDRFGCTVCHGGQGQATTYRDAAHEPLAFWPEPIRPRELIEANCGTCHRERHPAQAFLLSAGRDTIAEAGCIACHDMPGFTSDEIRAPRLESVGYKVRSDWLGQWLTDPQSYLSLSRMPNFRLQTDEIANLATFLLSQRATPPLDSSGVDWADADPENGRTLFSEARCVSCHQIDGRGGTLGPDLTLVGSKVRREWLFSFLKNPMHSQPSTLMLQYGFDDDEVRDVTAYLMTELSDPSVPVTPPETRFMDPGSIEAGREAFIRHGCYSCHRFEGMAGFGKIGPSLVGIGDRAVEASEFEGAPVVPTLPNWLFLKLREPDRLTVESRMPTYNFTDTQAATATLALLSIRRADLPASRVTDVPPAKPYDLNGEFGALVSRYRCLSCHQIQASGGEMSTVPLDRIGSQLQRSHIETYLLRPSAIRVSVVERMPFFRMTQKEAETLAGYLSTVFVDDALNRPLSSDAEAPRRGRRLFEDLGCRSCHMLDGTGGYVGPDLSDSGRRLEPGWIDAWLSDPSRWKPGTLQPNYGLQPPEVQDLTAYLMTLSTADEGSPR